MLGPRRDAHRNAGGRCRDSLRLGAAGEREEDEEPNHDVKGRPAPMSGRFTGTLCGMGMNRWQFGVIAALLAALLWTQAFPLLFPQRATPQWEYRIEGISDAILIEKLDRMGAGGWELVFARRALDDGKGLYEVILKRPL